MPSPGDLPYLGIEPQSPILQVDPLLSELPGKPKNTEVGSLFLLQGIIPTQGSNLGLPHCRQILYHLSQQGSSYVYTHGYYNFLYPGLASNVTEDIFRYYIFMSIILKSYSVVLSAAAAKSL